MTRRECNEIDLDEEKLHRVPTRWWLLHNVNLHGEGGGGGTTESTNHRGGNLSTWRSQTSGQHAHCTHITISHSGRVGAVAADLLTRGWVRLETGATQLLQDTGRRTDQDQFQTKLKTCLSLSAHSDYDNSVKP